ncbi:major facilitator superfamily domain-containing protein [Exophiala viscosa]|uniref:Major facilitator superfamily domain-containing protein n=1 Tax=Exophiala viscosa TaxID=2486360 RepID=A0AAN6DPS1_9EURO|nr:major facilitator superfamily domain-containing protein [Exophiala viscosa]KAI1628602.1 major facilitator superfamily domain-containing protein [Exophiala viscosa]
MGLGILESSTPGHVPGTVLLDQIAAHSEQQTGRLKHGSGKAANLVLAPQPSEDPNDPLNWSSWKKHMVLAVIFFGVVIHGCVPSPLLNAGVVEVAADLKRTPTAVAQISGYMLLCTGAVGPFVSAIGRKYGKRPVYVVSSLFGTLGIIISESASGYSTLLAGRILQGVGIAAYEALVIATIGDIFFVHERGPRVAVAMFLLAAISNGVSIIAGVITANLGWHYNFYICLPFGALQTILVILFAPETMYRRRAIYEIDTAGSEENLEKLAQVEMRHVEHSRDISPDGESKDIERTTTAISSVGSIPAKKTFVQELALYTGTYVDDPLWKMVVASVAILLNVGCLYQIVMTGLIIAWYVAVAITSGVIFASPPYLLGSATIGYMSAGPLIGGFFGALFPFFTAEPLVKFMTKRNRGVYEPEFCLLPVMSIGMVCAVAGLAGWGRVVSQGASIYLVCFLWGVMLFGMTTIASFCTQWSLDAYRQHSTELFIMNMVFKNFFFYGLTNYVIDWWVKDGSMDMAGIMAGLTAALCLLSVPIYIFGKRYRNFWHHNNLLKKLHLETTNTEAVGGH